MLAGGDGFTKKSPGAMVCHCCGTNRSTALPKFGGQEVALEGIKRRARLTGVRVLITYGGALKSAAARMVQGVVNGARKVARTVRRGKWGPRRQMPKDKCALNLELLRTSSRQNCGAHCCNYLH